MMKKPVLYDFLKIMDMNMKYKGNSFIFTNRIIKASSAKNLNYMSDYRPTYTQHDGFPFT